MRLGPLGAEALRAQTAYRLGDAPGASEVRVERVRRHRDRYFAAIAGVATIEGAQAYVGAALYAPRESVPRAPGEYLDSELIGLRIVDDAELERGVVVAIEHYPAQDCLVVDPGRRLVPLVRAFVREIDLPRGVIRMDLPAGLLDPGDAAEA